MTVSYHVYAVVRGNLVRVWSPNEHQALGLAASYRKLYPEYCDAWIEGLMPRVRTSSGNLSGAEPDF